MLAENLKTAREKTNLSRKEIAEKVGVTVSAYNYFEAGDKIPSLAVAKRLSEVLKVSLDWLCDLKQ